MILSLEVSRKLGAVGAHELSLIASVPTGSSDAVRQGVVLPQHLQLGSGVPGLSAQYQHTRDRDWGLTILGGALSYGGWENGIGDWRAPSATAFAGRRGQLQVADTKSAWKWVLITPSMVNPYRRASSRYSVMSRRGSTTTARPVVSSPIRYDACDKHSR